MLLPPPPTRTFGPNLYWKPASNNIEKAYKTQSFHYSFTKYLEMLSRSVPIVFDTATLSLFTKRLLNSPKFKLNYKKDVKDAAVLVPLCVVEGKPSILFTVRNMNMRTHSGEIR